MTNKKNVVTLTTIILLSLFQISCSEEYDTSSDLNIKVVEKSLIVSTIDHTTTIYPNPFNSVVSITIGQGNATLNITNSDGYKEFEFSNSINLDFSDEKEGVYNCELVIDGEVERYLLVKL